MDETDIEALENGFLGRFEELLGEAQENGFNFEDNIEGSLGSHVYFNFEELVGEDFSFKNEMGENERSRAEDQSQDNIEGRSSNNNILPPKEKENRKLELYKAAIIGDWKKAEEIFNNSKYITPGTKISKLGETALHIATAADHTKFVQHLVDQMSEDDLAIKTEKGNTAFFYAAVSGNIQAATFMLSKHPDLSIIRGEGNILPIRIAALHGHQKMVHKLYKHMKNQHMKGGKLASNDWLHVFIACIDCDIYDIGKQMLRDKPWLARKVNSQGLTALYSFARKSGITSHNFSSNICGRLLTKYFSNNALRKQGLELLEELLKETMSVTEEKSSELIKKALFRAAKQGNHEFLTRVIKSYRHLAFELDENNYTIFHIAVSHRHVKIFNIVHEMDSIKNVIKLMKDNDGNNILHLAGKLPLSGVEVAPGAALQLQHELLWFEEVKKVVGPQQMEAKNVKGKTPTDLFNVEHEDLRKQGEEWMKSTVNSCMVVSTLVAGVAFASAIAVPGGTAENTGIPLLLTNFWFKYFALFDAFSLILSASSILFFLIIVTSQYSMTDFLKSLLIKFNLGLVLLFAAVQAMIATFVAAFFIIFKHHMPGFASFIAATAFIVIIYFFRLVFPFVLYVIRFTFMSFLLFRRNK